MNPISRYTEYRLELGTVNFIRDSLIKKRKSGMKLSRSTSPYLHETAIELSRKLLEGKYVYLTRKTMGNWGRFAGRNTFYRISVHRSRIATSISVEDVNRRSSFWKTLSKIKTKENCHRTLHLIYLSSHLLPLLVLFRVIFLFKTSWKKLTFLKIVILFPICDRFFSFSCDWGALAWWGSGSRCRWVND